MPMWLVSHITSLPASNYESIGINIYSLKGQVQRHPIYVHQISGSDSHDQVPMIFVVCITSGSPSFTLLQLEMPTDGAWTSWCASNYEPKQSNRTILKFALCVCVFFFFWGGGVVCLPKVEAFPLVRTVDVSPSEYAVTMNLPPWSKAADNMMFGLACFQVLLLVRYTWSWFGGYSCPCYHLQRY